MPTFLSSQQRHPSPCTQQSQHALYFPKHPHPHQVRGAKWRKRKKDTYPDSSAATLSQTSYLYLKKKPQSQPVSRTLSIIHITTELHPKPDRKRFRIRTRIYSQFSEVRFSSVALASIEKRACQRYLFPKNEPLSNKPSSSKEVAEQKNSSDAMRCDVTTSSSDINLPTASSKGFCCPRNISTTRINNRLFFQHGAFVLLVPFLAVSFLISEKSG